VLVRVLSETDEHTGPRAPRDRRGRRWWCGEFRPTRRAGTGSARWTRAARGCRERGGPGGRSGASRRRSGQADEGLATVRRSGRANW